MTERGKCRFCHLSAIKPYLAHGFRSQNVQGQQAAFLSVPFVGEGILWQDADKLELKDLQFSCRQRKSVHEGEALMS